MSELVRRLVKYVFGKDLGAETIRYLIIGALTTLVNFGIFVPMHELAGIDYTVSNVTSISISILFAYITNKIFVFRRRCDTKSALVQEFLKFVSSRLITMALEIGSVMLFADVLAWNATVGKVVSQVLVVTVNYVASKIIVFRERKA